MFSIFLARRETHLVPVRVFQITEGNSPVKYIDHVTIEYEDNKAKDFKLALVQKKSSSMNHGSIRYNKDSRPGKRSSSRSCCMYVCMSLLVLVVFMQAKIFTRMFPMLFCLHYTGQAEKRDNISDMLWTSCPPCFLHILPGASSVAPAHQPLRARARSLYIYLDSC